MDALVIRLGFIAAVCAGLLICPPATRAEKSSPNVVLILADDLGIGDVQCYNPDRGKIPTPNIDQLAADGMRFTDAHSSSAVCSPSRYTLLTGRYHWRTRLQRGIVELWEPPLIAPQRLTVAGLAKRRGYQTACIGKWHLGWDWGITAGQRKFFGNFGPEAGAGRGPSDPELATWKEVFSKPLGGGPLAAGFDRYFGADVPNWPPYCFIEDHQTVGVPDSFLPRDMVRKGLASHQGPALAGWKFEPILPALGERASAFIRDCAQRSKPFFLYFPLTVPHTPLSVNEPWRGKSRLDRDVADLVMEMDDVVGKVLSSLNSAGVASNTLVIFTSDNGFAPVAGNRELESKGHFPSGPYRGYKFDPWEGGHRVPFIVRWPGVVQPGASCEALIHHADLMATLAAVWEVTLPEDAAEDSFNILPLLKGSRGKARKHAVSCAFNGAPTLRQDEWKLVCAPDERLGTRVHLFNLKNDPAETKNLATAQPDRVRKMRAALDGIIDSGRSARGKRQANDVEVRRHL